jgi:hypothetical protein
MKHVTHVKEKVESVKHEHIVPRHPQFVFIEVIDEQSWKAHDKETEKYVVVSKKLLGKFYHFEITYPR